MFITDAYSGMVFPYFMRTQGKADETKLALRDFVYWIRRRYGYETKIIRSDRELFKSEKIKRFLRVAGISGMPSASNTQSQNGGAERSGGAVSEQARTMRIAAGLPHNLWKQIFEAACYLKNKTPRESNEWKTPHELFLGTKPELSHLRAYGCKAYAMTAEAQLKKEKLWKLNPRAHIGYLVGYDSTNIYKIWVPHRGEIISTCDVRFDESLSFDGKKTPIELVQSINDLVHQVKIPDEEKQYLLDLEEADGVELSHQYRDQDESDDVIEDVDEPVLDSIVVNTSTYFGADNQIGQLDENAGNQDSQDSQHPDKNGEWENGLPTPPLTDPDVDEGPESIFAVNLPVRPEGVRASGSVFTTMTSTSAPTAKEPIDWDDQDWPYSYRFSDFERTPVETAVHGMFVAGTQFKPKKVHKRNIPEAPKTLKDLAKHPLRDDFRRAQENHLQEHENMGSFSEVPWSRAKGARILSSMWVFTYKTDKHGFLVKCKARLVVCGNQQEKGDLPTRATTLASMSFRALMAIAAEYDLELEQMDAVNAFVNCDLDEIVYMRMPPGFEKYGRVLWLRKALYGLRRSPLLWQKDLTKSLQALGFKNVPQEPCVMIKGKVIVFFFVDDIIWAYRKEDALVAQKAIEGLKARYKMTSMGEPKWFLGIHILRDKRSRKIWLTQDAYIDKIVHRFGLVTDIKLPDTPMDLAEVLPSKENASKQSVDLYQQKIGSVLFAAISTRPDIAFSVSRLARFNLNPSKTHHMAADRVILYLYKTRSYAIRLGGMRKIETFLTSSDSSFADNTLDRKSSQGMIMRLFGGTIAWKASKQATVTTSSTEAELLALSQAAKEAIFTARLLKALAVILEEPLQLECDNKQTIRLLEEESTKLTTQLRHVDIHQHWLRQEVQQGRIAAKWVKTSAMIADGMTKVLAAQKHKDFVVMLGMNDIRNKIELETRLEDLRDQLKESIKARTSQDGNSEEAVILGYTAGKQRKKPLEKGTRPRRPRQTRKVRFDLAS
jgi:hypothetical protein